MTRYLATCFPGTGARGQKERKGCHGERTRFTLLAVAGAPLIRGTHWPCALLLLLASHRFGVWDYLLLEHYAHRMSLKRLMLVSIYSPSSFSAEMRGLVRMTYPLGPHRLPFSTIMLVFRKENAGAIYFLP